MTNDFRSDTVTRATPEMREAMAAADVGDDVYGEDPTVNALQDRVATLTGKETALLLTSGTQSNLTAVLTHCGRGDEYLVGRNSHILLNEAGGASALGGTTPWPLETDDDGSFAPEDVLAAIKESDVHHPVTRLLCLENTVNGYAQPVDRIAGLAAAARAGGLAVHLDGARLWNAAVAKGVPVADYLHGVDTVSLCLSKGLGAPAGTVLAGSRDDITRAHRIRKQLGGGMRQAGHLAAAGLHALDHHVDRLADDHRRARTIADGLAGLVADGLLAVRQDTNMVWVTPVAEHHAGLTSRLAADGVLVTPWSPTMRIVTHLDVGDDDVEALLASFRTYFDGV